MSDYITLKSIDDLRKAYGIECKYIRGYNMLGDKSKAVFENFLVNVYNACGYNIRWSFIPISVHFVNDYGKKYLRFDYKKNGRLEWLHVFENGEWY